MAGIPIIAIALCCLWAGSSHAQTPARSGAPPKARPAVAAPVTLSEQPFRIESLGLTIFVPEGSEARADQVGTITSGTILPSRGDWRISIQAPRAANEQTTAAQLVDGYVLELLRSVSDERQQLTREEFDRMVQEVQRTGAAKPARDGLKTTHSRGTLLAREPLPGAQLEIEAEGKNMAVERAYVRLPQPFNKKDVVRGITAARLSPTQFIVFELTTPIDEYDFARRTFEICVATARFEDPSLINTRRATAVAMGMKLLEQWPRESLVSLVRSQPERWERIYVPSPSGRSVDDREVGYRRVMVEVGPRSAVGGGGPVADTRDGLIVRIQARILEGDAVIDSVSAFFVSQDRKEEIWSVKMTSRRGGDTMTVNETGARADDQMTVRIDGQGITPTTVKPQIAGEGYVSRVESFLLPLLLVRKGIAGEYGFYVYQSQAQRIQLRRDVLDRDPDREGVWKLATRLSEDQPDQVSWYKDSGELIRSDLPAGRVSEPTTPADLLALWKTKGLPVGGEK